MTGGEAHIAIADCYAHCAKALIRSAFWQAEPGAAPTGDAAAFAAATRFMALATVDPHGAADISPKGDPAGSMVRLDAAGDPWLDRKGVGEGKEGAVRVDRGGRRITTKKKGPKEEQNR